MNLPTALRAQISGRAWDLALFFLMAIVAVGLRALTFGVVSPFVEYDEPYHALFAQEVTRVLEGKHGAPFVRDLANRFLLISIPGALAVALPCDALCIGRAAQLLFNALTVPLVYLLARSLHFGRLRASLAAGILLVAPGLWREAGHFWADSQLAFLVLAFLCAAAASGWGSKVLPWLAAALFAGALVTKEYLAPALGVVWIAALITWGVRSQGGLVEGAAVSRRQSSPPRLLLVAALIVALLAAAYFVFRADRIIVNAAQLVVHWSLTLLPTIATSLDRVPSFVHQLPVLTGRQAFGAVAALLALIGFAWLGGRAGASLVGRGNTSTRQSDLRVRLADVTAFLIWGAAAGLAWLGVVGPGVALPLAVGAACMGLAAFWSGRLGIPQAGDRAAGGGTRAPHRFLLPLGVLLLGVMGTRFVLYGSELAGTTGPRNFLPAYPVIALSAATGASIIVALGHQLLRGLGPPQASFSALSLLVFSAVVLATPTVDYLAKGWAGAGAGTAATLNDPDVIKARLLAEARDWLQSNLKPSDRVLASRARFIAWEAGTGLEGYRNSAEYEEEEIYRSVRARFSPESKFDYVAEYSPLLHNQWLPAYYWLRTRDYAQEVYRLDSPDGWPQFFVFKHMVNPTGQSSDELARSIRAEALYQARKDNIASRLTVAPLDSRLPSLAAAADGFGVAWQDSREGDSPAIYFSRLSGSGVKPGDEMRISSPDRPAQHPSLVWSGSEYALAWQQREGARSRVHFRKLPISGEPRPPDLEVPGPYPAEADFVHPVLAWSGDGYGLAFQAERAGLTDVYFLALDGGGVPRGAAVRVGTEGVSRNPSLACSAGVCLLAWEDGHAREGGVRIAQIGSVDMFDPRGQVVAGEGARRPGLAWGGGEAGVTWTQPMADGRQGLSFARVNVGASSDVRPVLLSDRLGPDAMPTVAYDTAGHAVAWSEKVGGTEQVLFARIDRGVQTLSAKGLVTTDRGPGAREPRLAWNGSMYGLAWADQAWGWTEIAFTLRGPQGQLEYWPWEEEWSKLDSGG